MKTLFEHFEQLETNRILVRALKQEDSKGAFEIFSNDEVVLYQQIPALTTMQQASQSVDNFIKGYTDKIKIRRSIVDKESNKMIGIISLHSFDYEHKTVDIGFMLNRSYWNKGIMTETARLVIDYVFSHTDCNAIIAKVVPENIGSKKVCIKLGFEEIEYRKESALNFRTNEKEDQIIYELKRSHV